MYIYIYIFLKTTISLPIWVKIIVVSLKFQINYLIIESQIKRVDNNFLRDLGPITY